MTHSDGPKLSFGIPVYNGVKSLPRLLDSLAAQTYANFEVVISDNHSTDGTPSLCQDWCARDRRLRFFAQTHNAGIVANFNRVFRLARGEFFRWVGADDWLEPTYAEKCVHALTERPDAIGVSTYQAHWSGGERDYLEYRGRRVDSDKPQARFSTCLWLMNEDYRYFDPMYSMHRRRVLERTRGLRPVLNGDQMLAAELSLLGPYVHVAECLANRGKPQATREAVLKLLRSPNQPPLDPNPEQFLRLLGEMIHDTPLSLVQRAACYQAALGYYLQEFETTRVRPIRVRTGVALRSLGVPMDQISPFH